MLALFNFLNRWYIHMIKNTFYTKNTMPQYTHMPSLLGFSISIHTFFFKYASIYKYKAFFLSVFTWSDITYTPSAFYHLIFNGHISPDSFFTLVVAWYPYCGCHYLVEQYHSRAFGWFLDLVHMSLHVCIRTSLQ